MRRQAVSDAVQACGLETRAARILDVGGYDGSVSAALPGDPGRIVVLDVDGTGLARARTSGAAAIAGSATAIPMASASADLALVCDLLPCVEEDEAARVYPEVARILRPGGHVIVTEVDAAFDLPFADRDAAFSSWGARNGGYSYEQLAGLLGAAGLRVVERRRFYGLPTRLAYSVFFVHVWPRRGARVKQRLFGWIVAGERWWRPRPRANLVVATRVAAERG